MTPAQIGALPSADVIAMTPMALQAITVALFHH
jgi:hypothetical protein